MIKTSIKNYYNMVPKDLNPKAHNPKYRHHLITVPFRILICGPAGSGKSNTLCELIHRMSGTFERLIVCCKSKDEPLYALLEQKLEDSITFYEQGEVPDLGSYVKGTQTLIVFDDLCLEKDQRKISQFFIQGRKKDFSCAYLTQSYFKTPKEIRCNCDYIILKRLSGQRDLKTILSEYTLGVDKDQLLHIYKQCTQDPLSFLLISINSGDSEKFRCGFLPIGMEQPGWK